MRNPRGEYFWKTWSSPQADLQGRRQTSIMGEERNGRSYQPA